MQPVFDTIVRNAKELLGGHSVAVTRVIGDEIHLMAFNSVSREGDAVLHAGYPIRLDQLTPAERMAREGTPTIMEDVETSGGADGGTNEPAESPERVDFGPRPDANGP